MGYGDCPVIKYNMKIVYFIILLYTYIHTTTYYYLQLPSISTTSVTDNIMAHHFLMLLLFTIMQPFYFIDYLVRRKKIIPVFRIPVKRSIGTVTQQLTGYIV